MAKLSTIFDPFDGDGPDTGLWNDNSAGVSQALGDGYAEITASGDYHFMGYTPPSRDFTEDAFQWEWTFTAAPTSGTEQLCAINNGIAGEEFQFGRFSTSLGYFMGAADGFVPWSDTDHRWCRIRTTTTQVFFETSADGDIWVNPFSGGEGVETLPAWDLSEVQVHFINGFFSGTGGGTERIHTVGVDSGELSGSLTGSLGAISTQIDAGLTMSGSLALPLGPAAFEAGGNLKMSGSLGGALAPAAVDLSGTFESSAQDVTLSVGPTRVATTGVGSTVLSPSVADTIVERSP
jgi:hypothetical protein